jgi:ascorbate-specific PTS system EIIC-type component UlaA
MRITVRVTLGVLTAMLSTFLLLGVGTGTASAAEHPVAAVAGVSHQAAAAPTTTAAPTTDYNKGQQQANASLAQRKVVIGVICIVLLIIVYFGRKAKGKHILRNRNLQNAKS